MVKTVNPLRGACGCPSNRALRGPYPQRSLRPWWPPSPSPPPSASRRSFSVAGGSTSPCKGEARDRWRTRDARARPPVGSFRDPTVALPDTLPRSTPSESPGRERPFCRRTRASARALSATKRSCGRAAYATARWGSTGGTTRASKWRPSRREALRTCRSLLRESLGVEWPALERAVGVKAPDLVTQAAAESTFDPARSLLRLAVRRPDAVEPRVPDAQQARRWADAPTGVRQRAPSQDELAGEYINAFACRASTSVHRALCLRQCLDPEPCRVA